jgi:hypothetical protein
LVVGAAVRRIVAESDINQPLGDALAALFGVASHSRLGRINMTLSSEMIWASGPDNRRRARRDRAHCQCPYGTHAAWQVAASAVTARDFYAGQVPSRVKELLDDSCRR